MLSPDFSFDSINKDHASKGIALIMAGGYGTRFWPLSRECNPKQFLKFAGGDKSLIQKTVERVEPVVGRDSVLIISSINHSRLLAEQLPDIKTIFEPCSKNTAPCVAFSALVVKNFVGDVPFLSLPADHIIHGQGRVEEVFNAALSMAGEEDVLITIGLRPSHPETGYGYIKAESSKAEGLVEVSEVECFVEKPILEVAKKYLLEGNYFWNSGMFAWRPSVILSEILNYLPAYREIIEQLDVLLAEFKSANKSKRSEISIKLEDVFAKFPPESIDFGVMEKSSRVKMIVGDGFSWSDVGSWRSWYENVEDKDVNGNVALGNVKFFNTKNSAVVGGNRFIATVGVDDLVIVDSEDALLVCDLNSSQDVKEVVNFLKKSDTSQLL